MNKLKDDLVDVFLAATVCFDHDRGSFCGHEDVGQLRCALRLDSSTD